MTTRAGTETRLVALSLLKPISHFNFKWYLGRCTVLTLYAFQSLASPNASASSASHLSEERETTYSRRTTQKSFQQKPRMRGDPDLRWGLSVGHSRGRALPSQPWWPCPGLAPSPWAPHSCSSRSPPGSGGDLQPRDISLRVFSRSPDLR